MTRLPDGASQPRQPRPTRTRAKIRADLVRSIEQARTPLEQEQKRRALACLDREAAA